MGHPMNLANIDLTRGLGAARFLKSLSYGEGRRDYAAAYAMSQGWYHADAIASALKAGTPATGDDDLRRNPAMTDLAGLVRPRTIIGRLPGAKRLPFLARTIGLSAGTTAYWRAGGVAVPVSGATFAAPTLLSRKSVHSLLVTTDAFLRETSPIAERALVEDLIRAIAVAIDNAFLDPGNTGGDEIPASITSTGYTTSSSGSSLSQVDGDLRGLIEELVDAGADLTTAVWCLHPRSAAFLASLRGTSGSPAFPNVGLRGGEIFGLPALVSAGVPMDGSPAESIIALVSGDGVAIADEGEMSLDMARHATIEMATDPTGDAGTPTAASKQLVSMFATNSVAIQASTYLNWCARRSTMAATLTDVAY